MKHQFSRKIFENSTNISL